MATLGNIRWGAQYSTTDPTGEDASTKTINGLNLDESATDEAETVNAGLVNDLVTSLMALSTRQLTNANLVETRKVNSDG